MPDSVSCLRLFWAVVLSAQLMLIGCNTESPPTPSVGVLPEPGLDKPAALPARVVAKCKTLNEMAERWSVKRSVAGGFSDLPVDVPQPPAQAISDEEIEKIAAEVREALADPHHEVRKAAAICLCHAPRPSPGVDAAIDVALRSKDGSVLWYLMQIDARTFSFPEPEPYVANLIEHLKSKNFNSQFAATDLLNHFGKSFTPHTGAVIDVLGEIPENDRSSVLLTLARVGLSEAAADRLPTRVAKDVLEVRAAAAVALMPYPDKAMRFLQKNPEIGPALSQYAGHWNKILYSSAPEQAELLAALIAIPGLGPMDRALIGSRDAIPELTRELESADKHRQSLLRACIRACGGDLREIIHLSAEKPVVFKPASAWPETDTRRESNQAGHGDGFTEILVTGELQLDDGSHPGEVQFLRANDSMLMGSSTNLRMPLKYDGKTGRFVFRDSIFAAYAVGKTPEPGPYQTGSSQIRIESSDCGPLVVQFFDEMPHVVIHLKRP